MKEKEWEPIDFYTIGYHYGFSRALDFVRNGCGDCGYKDIPEEKELCAKCKQLRAETTGGKK